MSQLLLILAVVGVSTILCSAGSGSKSPGSKSSGSTGSNSECTADLEFKDKCNCKDKYFYFNQTSCRCEQSEQCLKGSNSFTTEAECNCECPKGVTLSSWGGWSECSETCGLCTQRRNRTCKTDGQSECGCSGVESVDTKLIGLPACGRPFASFSAKLSSSMSNVSFGEIIKFDALINNNGNHYDPDTGIFTAPYSGVYIFHFHVANLNAGPNKSAHVSLYVDEIIKIGARADGTNGGLFESGSNSAILQLSQGQEVYIKTREVPIWHSLRHFKTSFHGALLHAD